MVSETLNFKPPNPVFVVVVYLIELESEPAWPETMEPAHPSKIGMVYTVSIDVSL